MRYGALFLTVFILVGAGRDDSPSVNAAFYTTFSRVTDPQDLRPMLGDLPPDIDAICTLAKNQTVHHNLLGYFDVPRQTSLQMSRVWPPRMPDILGRLQETGPRSLSNDRQIEDRIISACILESHFLAGLLRSKGYAVRIRAGYFRNVSGTRDHFIAFWKDALHARGVMESLFASDSSEWNRIVEDVTNKQFDNDHNIEHWVCEYWNEDDAEWQILDANDTFLKAHSRVDVSFRLSRDHFEFAYEAWKKMRSTEKFNPDQYSEEPQDGRSHIRSQLLWDFYSLLNHDISGYNGSAEDSASDGPEQAAFAFVKDRTYDECSSEELGELDALAALLETNPTVEALRAFYRASRTLRLENAERDPYSFVFVKK